MQFGNKYGPLVTPQEFIERSIVRVPWSGCWLWERAQQKRGYGVVCIRGKIELAHRFSYIVYKGPINENLKILHRCDVPLCVNPDHLFAGTDRDNLVDAYLKGRKGKLSTSDIKQIKLFRKNGHSLRALARLFGVTFKAISYWDNHDREARYAAGELQLAHKFKEADKVRKMARGEE
jgi:hypothetical protein